MVGIGAAAAAGVAVAAQDDGDDEGGGNDGGLVGASGDVRVNIEWNNSRVDLDLRVTDPCGNVITFSNRASVCNGYTGRLDVDARGGNGTAENITWTSGAPRGTYRVAVNYFGGSGSASYTARVFVGSVQRTYTGTISIGTDQITQFTFGGSGHARQPSLDKSAITKDALGAQGRTQLASVRDTIGRRFARTRASGLRIPRISRLSARSLLGNTRRATSPIVSGTHSNSLSQMGKVEAKRGGKTEASDRAVEGEGWSVWGAGDTQSFGDSSNSQDGSTRSYYLGVDGPVGPWTLGLAMSHSDTDAMVRPNSRIWDGSYQTRIASVHPYAHRHIGKTELWAIGGIGEGQIRVGRGPETEFGRMDVRLGILGAKRQIQSGGATTLSLHADAGVANVGADIDSLPGLSANIGTFRGGIEGELLLATALGALRPFWQMNGRADSGDGTVGSGLELVAGTRFLSNRLDVDLQGRWLAFHSSSQEEFSLSGTVQVRPRRDGRGVTATLSPRWGPLREPFDALNDFGTPLHLSPDGERQDEWSLDGSLGYGFRLPSSNAILTPFIETSLGREAIKRNRVGMRLTNGDRRWEHLEGELGLLRLQHPTGVVEGAVTIRVSVQP